MLFSPIADGEALQPSRIRLRAISLGAGVQSTTMALMAAHGEIGPMPDCAIFADTGWEPRAVYDHLEWLISPNVLPFTVHIVSAGNIRDELMAAGDGNRWASIPAFAKTVTPAGAAVPVYDEDDDGELIEIGSRSTSRETVSIGMIKRQCTTDFKIVPIRRKVRELAGLTRKRSPDHAVVEQWIGISCDEIVRAKPSFEAWQVKRFPLIERRMSRQDCLAWLRRHDYPVPPKSACIGCPFHDNGRWRHMRDHDPEAWAMPSRSIGCSGPAFVVSGVRSTSIAPMFRWTKPICRRPPIAGSSISGPTNARGMRCLIDHRKPRSETRCCACRRRSGSNPCRHRSGTSLPPCFTSFPSTRASGPNRAGSKTRLPWPSIGKLSALMQPISIVSCDLQAVERSVEA